MPTASGKKMSLLSQKGLLLWLTGLTIVYQLFYQFFMWHALREEASQEECSTIPDSPMCVEAQLFRSWQEKTVPLLETKGRSIESLSQGDEPSIAPPALTEVSSTMAPTTPTGASSQSVAPGLASNASSHTAAESVLKRLTAGGAATEKHNAWEHDFVAQARQAHMELCSEPQRQQRPDCVKFLATVSKAERQQEELQQRAHELDRGLESVRERHATWQLDFDKQVEQAKLAMCAEPRHHELPECQKFLHIVSKTELRKEELHQRTAELEKGLEAVSASHKAWQLDFDKQVQQALLEMCNEPQHRDLPQCAKVLAKAAKKDHQQAEYNELKRMTAELDAGFKAVDDNHAKWEHNFAEKVEKVELDYCLEHSQPSRRNRPDCQELIAAHLAQAHPARPGSGNKSSVVGAYEDLRQHAAELENGLSAIRLAHESWERDFNLEVLQTQVDFCNEPRHRSKSFCVEVLARAQSFAAQAKASSTAHAAKHLRHGHQQLRWPSVAGGAATGQVVLGPEELQAARWAGKLPKVACISAIPSGHADRDVLWRLINNYYTQSYEGQRQLVLVYDHTDDEAGRLAQLFANGRDILAVAAHDRLPSTVGMRFGAWTAAKDAEVIAQWDYDVKHEPTRLSLQVRALALSTRPASILQQPAGAAAGDLRASTLLGEAKWMRQHWHPLAAGQPASLQSALEDQLAQVSSG